MSEQAELKKELARWKDKYFTQNELFEEDKRFAEEYANLLQRLLIRVSLAADSVSEDLDAELNALRSAIRKATPQENDLEKRLKRIDELILSTDQSKQENAEKVVSAMEQLVEQLLSIQLPRKAKNQLKKLSKSLDERASHFREYPGILTEYAVLQAEALKLIVGGESKEQGFFDRLFNKQESKKEPVQSILPVSDDDTKQQDITVAEAELSVAGSSELSPREEYVPGFASIAGHVRSTLSNLLDQLEFPDSASRDVGRLRRKIDSKMNWYELGPTLDDVASLVIAVVGRSQREFERFLVSLDERLAQVQSYLMDGHESDQARVNRRQELDHVVRTRVSAMEKEIQSVSDIKDLKLSVNQHLDLISSTMKQFSHDEAMFEKQKEKEIERLRERLKEMETESEAMKEQIQEERKKALKDGLTGLPNREAFDERFEMEIARFIRYGKPATLVVGDIDFFKSVNDNYGHLSGDKVLQIIAKELQNRTRKTDFVARYGGEEFVVVLPETSLDTAIDVMNKTREMISRLPFHFKEERLSITMSFGLVAFDAAITKDEMFELADQALYQAKENGRNRVEVAQNKDSESE